MLPNSFGPAPPSFTHHITSGDAFTNISDQAMHLVWNCTPAGFQREVIPRLPMMRCAPYNPQVLLLVQCAGGGKSDVAQTVGCCDYGMILIIVETLALAADQ